MKCRLIHDTPAAPTIPPNKIIQPAGTIVEHPDAYVLVQIGMAVAVDDECTKAVGRTPKQLKQAQYEHMRTVKGIHPDDFHLYDAGRMDGYNPDGTIKPGPNFVEEEEEEESNLILPEGFDDENEEEDEDD